MKINKSILPYFILFTALFQFSLVNSQVKKIGSPEIKNFKRKEYKGGTQNWDIDQDAKGNLYFANNNGLLKFNGTNWQRFIIPNNVAIKSIKTDPSGKIYVGGNNEFGYFSSDKKGKLIYHSLSDLFQKKVSNINLIWKIHLYQGEVIFQSFTKLFILKNNTLRYFESKSKFQFSFLANNNLYIQDKKHGLLLYSRGKFTPLKGTSSLNNSEVWNIFPISNNKLIIATLENGLFIYDNHTLKPWQSEANNYIKKHSSLGGCMIKNKILVFNTVQNGIIITDLNGKIIKKLNRQMGLLNNTVLKSFIDRENNLWLGLDNGISFIAINSPFSYFDYSYNMSTVYSSLLHKNILYVATNQGLFYHNWDEIGLEDPFKRVKGTIAQAWKIQLINGQLLCATNNGALLIENNKTAKILDRRGYLGFFSIPNQPDYIIGENYSGFSVFKQKNSSIEFVNTITGFEDATNFSEILIDEDFFWIKKGDKLYQMKLTDDLKKFEQIKIHSKINNNYKGIGSIQKINGKIYFQIRNHFYRYSKDQEIFFEDYKMTSLFKSIPPVEETIEDSKGNIWYYYNESLGTLQKNKNNGYLKKQDLFLNLKGNLVANYLSINEIDQNNIFIGLTDGLAHFSFDNSASTNKKPIAYIERFSTSRDTIITATLSPKKQVYNLSYDSNQIKFAFSSPIFSSTQDINYSYKLEPFEEDWSKWSPNSIKEYTNLREGNYIMNVKVKNSFGLESDPVTLQFSISPPWYRHSIAFFFYLILITLTVIIIYKRIKLKIRKNKYYQTIEQRRLYLERESKIRQEQHELEKEIEKLKNDKLQIQILTKDKELVSNSLQVVKKNKILNGILQKVKEIDTKDLDESTKYKVTKLNKSILKEVNNDKSWKNLEKHIKNVHFDFLKRLKEKYPTITPRELDLSTYLLMNMSTKEIAEIMNISTGGVELARYRLRKKLNLTKKDNLISFLMNI